MDTYELIKITIGIGLIIYGLCVNAYEKFNDMRFIDQINGVINGKLCIIIGVGILVFLTDISIGASIIALILLIIEEVFINKYIKKKN